VPYGIVQLRATAKIDSVLGEYLLDPTLPVVAVQRREVEERTGRGQAATHPIGRNPTGTTGAINIFPWRMVCWFTSREFGTGSGSTYRARASSIVRR
jgi:hypothetical protein